MHTAYPTNTRNLFILVPLIYEIWLLDRYYRTSTMSMDMSSWGFSKTLSPTPSAPAGRDFFDLVKSIGESKSKQEEDRIVAEEVAYLKKAFAASNANKRKAKELVIRSLYVEMLGQDATFSYLKIVELCASSSDSASHSFLQVANTS